VRVEGSFTIRAPREAVWSLLFDPQVLMKLMPGCQRLERVAEDEEFLDEAKDAPYEVISDYLFPGVENDKVATILAGVLGVLIVAALTFVVAFVLRRTGREERARPTSRPGGQA